MNKRIASFAVLGSMVVAGAFAAFQTRASPAPPPSSPESLPVIPSPEPDPSLPPDHPPIGAGANPHGSGAGANPHGSMAPEPADESSPLVWTAPPSWRSIPSTSSMRLATYAIPRARQDGEDGELSVVRAGGTTDANIQRWGEQFAESSKQTREEKTVRGLKVTVVSIKGTFLGGDMMSGAPSAPRPSWALLGAIVETPGSPYFFKLLGPVSTVNAARAPFDSMIAGLTHD